MGYTHYWRHAELPADLFAEIAADAKAIVAASPVPLAGFDGTGEPEFTEDEFSLNGADPDDYETFSLRTVATDYDFCKTGQRPYDVVVTAILLRAAALAFARDVKFEFWSDGDLDVDWAAGRELVGKVFGRGKEQEG
jgi:hypothetical protein